MIGLACANSLRFPFRSGVFHMIATSPPYWGLRSYATGDKKSMELGTERLHDCLAWARGDQPCDECYVCHSRTWAREAWRVLRSDGVMWLNLGDSYAGSWGNYGAREGNQRSRISELWRRPGYEDRENELPPTASVPGLKPKDLCMIPARVALALQADGWWLRSAPPWIKRNAMPESAPDRPTTAHEYIFLLSKSERYFWDQEAVKKGGATGAWASMPPIGGIKQTEGNSNPTYSGNTPASNGERILRTSDFFFDGLLSSNWQGMLADDDGIPLAFVVNTSGFSGAHFATWPPKLVEPMIKASTSERGCCHFCGAPWERIVKKGYRATSDERVIADMIEKGVPRQKANLYTRDVRDKELYEKDPDVTIGWKQTCECPPHEPKPCLVLDPFVGSGTTLIVARALGRSAVGVDLSELYLRRDASKRLMIRDLRAWESGSASVPDVDTNIDDLPLFSTGEKGV